MKYFLAACLLLPFIFMKKPEPQSWIRVNLLGYPSHGSKVAVWSSKTAIPVTSFTLVDVITGQAVFTGKAGEPMGAYGPFQQTCRLDFSTLGREGRFVIRAGDAISPEFTVAADVYKGAADFCLSYMRQQRSGFNPFLNDSCHTHDGYTLYGAAAGLNDSTHLDVSGGWHDASDYLQYATTSANATYHLLMAWRDFPDVFGDAHQANGLKGVNKRADVLDEAAWGLNWLLKMHPRPDWLFNQLGDDRDHISMRLPKEDSSYGKGFERPVYFASGRPQQRGKFMNQTTGAASVAAKFSSAFDLGAILFRQQEPDYAALLTGKAQSALQFAEKSPGFQQTASVKSPYIYTESNWYDDMELAYTMRQCRLGFSEAIPSTSIYKAYRMADKEPVTPWMGNDTATHYQWYPFVNVGHYELAKVSQRGERKTILGYIQKGIEAVWARARTNAFYHGTPFIWCSNNYTVAFAIQCYWYRMLTGDSRYAQLEQACFDWIFGVNPWGTSMVFGLPQWGDTPTYPHSAFTHIGHYPINGGLVDGPVYTSIFKSLIGITLNDPDEYTAFQSDLAVYHDDYGDYSTNEPTMDGTASLIYLLAAKESEKFRNPVDPETRFTVDHGAITTGNPDKRRVAIVFTADTFFEGAQSIYTALSASKVKASFFLTGNTLRNKKFQYWIRQLQKKGHYFGPHSDAHLLYCDWNNRQQLLVTQEEFSRDLRANLDAMKQTGLSADTPAYFIPPYEWYNDSIAVWSAREGFTLFNLTPGLLTHTDYKTPDMPGYITSKAIFEQFITTMKHHPSGLNGFIILIHAGSAPERKDKFYQYLSPLLIQLSVAGYECVTIPELLKH